MMSLPLKLPEICDFFVILNRFSSISERFLYKMVAVFGKAKIVSIFRYVSDSSYLINCWKYPQNE